ncbi:hypothetical protein V6Z12_A10G235400 [Gossypium hirsutum]
MDACWSSVRSTQSEEKNNFKVYDVIRANQP